MVSARRRTVAGVHLRKPRNWCRSCAVCSLTLSLGSPADDEALRGSVTSRKPVRVALCFAFSRRMLKC